MIVAKIDFDQEFKKKMNNLIEYSQGFLEGAEKGKSGLLKRLGENTKDLLESFIDSNARVNPEVLHHIYEWYQAGNDSARLFEITYSVKDSEVSFASSFTQSQSIARGSKEPFYDKARVMESGMSITVAPKSSRFLRFESGGDTVFTPNPVQISSPGGPATTGAFQKVFNSFFENFFNQSFLESTGLRKSFANVSIYTKNLNQGLMTGRSKGIEAGKKWINNINLEDM